MPPNKRQKNELTYTPIPGEYFYQGIRLASIFTAKTLDRIDALELTESDTIIIGFPKSGEDLSVHVF